MKKIRLFVFPMLVAVFASCSETNKNIDLSGVWTVCIESTSQTIHLPGSLSENGIGKPVMDSTTYRLTEKVSFTGKATYEREVNIPASFADKPVELYMERTKVSEILVNGVFIGSQNSVSAPHIYILHGLFKPGKNKLTVTVDNTKNLLPLGSSHAYSEDIPTNWNAILGDIHLRCMDDIDIRDVQIYPETNGTCRVKITVLNSLAEKKEKYPFKISIYDANRKKVSSIRVTQDIFPGISEQIFSLAVQQPELWDEYTPSLYSLVVKTSGRQKKEIRFGFRDFGVRSGQFVNNKRVVFLRGTHEGGLNPLTGYPSMEKEDWLRYYRIIRSYGLNHIRFHSWTPPRAAFEAADESGIFLQPELPLGGNIVPGDTTKFNYMKTEGEKIMQTYGNHPSFVMFSLGNELTGDTTFMINMVEQLRMLDDRRLYAMGSNNFYWDTKTYPVEDFFVSMRNGKEAPDNSTDVRASFSFADSDNGGIINHLKPNTERKFATATQNIDKPVIGHETGQYQIYPDYGEMEKYTGVLQARNFSVFKNRLEKSGMLSQADDFLKNSGALSALCYREEIEMALRTPGFGGFQLLDLKDYPGQGTALVGVLNAFLESKEVISREKWTEFCNDVVPLARFSKYCWTNAETFEASIEIANYGMKDLDKQAVHCVLKDADGKTVFQQDFSEQLLKQGKLTTIGKWVVSLEKQTQSQQLELIVQLSGSAYSNSWNIWVYPEENTEIREGFIQNVWVTRDRKRFEKAKNENISMVYIPHHGDIVEQSVGGLFISDFWNYTMFKNIATGMKKEPSPGTLGILTQPQHPLFNCFPTDTHTNWQWWNIVKYSRPMIMDHLSTEYLPIVQVIDNVERNHKLGLIYEIPADKGRILVCTSDLFACKEEPEVKALFQSMLNYLNSNR